MTVTDVTRAFLAGGSERWLAELSEAVGLEFGVGLPSDPQRGDLVVVDGVTAAASAALPLGNAFSTCRALKRDPAVLVFIAVRDGDSFGAEIARYCMADGVVSVDSEGGIDGLDRIQERIVPQRGRAPIDSLLHKLEDQMAADEVRVSSGLERILNEAESTGSIARWTDPETGLFDGPFAGFKIDEEFKRASRFHQPLSMVLLDAGVAAWPEDPDERRTVLAEISSIFLNECRDIDVLSRFTETVFLFLFPGTGPDGASVAAHRIVESLASREFSVDVAVRPAAGIATVPHPAVRDRRAFLARAESALDAARAAETDRVRSAGADAAAGRSGGE